MCKTETVISESHSKSQAIEKDFRPTNGRMSPESCQGFLDGYRDYQSLTRSYIQNCQQKISSARAACQREVPMAVQGDLSAFEKIAASLKTLKKAERELPKLEALLPPVDRLKSKLADCLIHTPGRIVNTDTDRGDADTSAQLNLWNGGGNVYPTGSQGTIRIAAVNHGSIEGFARSQNASASFSRATSGTRDQNSTHFDRTAKAQGGQPPQVLATRELSLRDGRGGLVTIATHDGVMPTRGPASLKSRGQLANPHRNIFTIVRQRYKAKEQTFWP